MCGKGVRLGPFPSGSLESHSYYFDEIAYIKPLHGVETQCKTSWNSCQDLAYSYIFPFNLETLDKILFIFASHKPLEFLDSILGKSLIKSVKRMNKL